MLKLVLASDWLIRGSHITQLKKINEGESNSKLPKIFAGKNLQMTQNKLYKPI